LHHHYYVGNVNPGFAMPTDKSLVNASLSPPAFAFQPQLVFAECGLGAIVLTVNVILLGGDIVFFQALCLLGYCLFPMCVAAIVCAATSNKVCANGCKFCMDSHVMLFAILNALCFLNSAFLCPPIWLPSCVPLL
jgi:hypothetical protein